VMNEITPPSRNVTPPLPRAEIFSGNPL
jgi:hypothetical protein